jgi:hypothetical protein
MRAEKKGQDRSQETVPLPPPPLLMLPVSQSPDVPHARNRIARLYREKETSERHGERKRKRGSGWLTSSPFSAYGLPGGSLMKTKPGDHQPRECEDNRILNLPMSQQPESESTCLGVSKKLASKEPGMPVRPCRSSKSFSNTGPANHPSAFEARGEEDAFGAAGRGE